VSTRLADRLWSASRRDNALHAIGEAVAVARRLADAEPATGAPALARNMSRQGYFLGKMGRLDEMLTCLRETVRVWRLVESDSSVEIALALMNMSVCLTKLERWDNALPLAREAVARLQEQEPSDPAFGRRTRLCTPVNFSSGVLSRLHRLRWVMETSMLKTLGAP
jgi:tetratricopeptide (TPR) repeat protein